MRNHVSLRDVDVIAPNFKRRLSGVTSTIIQLVPAQRTLGTRVAAIGPGLPDEVPRARVADLWRLWTLPANKPFRIWHARRNVEMLAGVVLRDVLGARLKLLFTSDAQRNHQSFTRWLIRRMDKVVTTNTRSASYLHVPYTMVVHGVDTSRFTPPNDKRSARTLVGFDPAKRYVGCFGRIRHQKGTDLFVDAMIAILPRRPEWIAVITGRVTIEHDTFAEGLRQKIKQAGLADRVQFMGEVPDIVPFYRAIDLYVAPSRNEGFGLTPLEAMACGVPAVTSDAGAYSDMIVKGETGIVVPAGDSGILTTEIGRYMDDSELLARHAEAALAHVRMNFALEREAAGLEAVYNELWKERVV